MASRDRSRSPSVEILWSTVRPRARSPSVEILGVRNVNTGAGAGASKAGTKRKSTGEERVGPAKKRAKNSSTAQAQDKTEKEKEKKEKEKKEKPEERWKWIDRTRPEIDLKGTRIQAHNCGGTFFKASAKKVADRLDKLEAFLDECGGDETAHECYGEPDLYKPKRVPASKKNKNNDPEEERWTWIDRARPDIQMRGTKLEAYNCGGCYFRASGRTVAERLDEMEAFLAECEGDETCHPSYGCF